MAGYSYEERDYIYKIAAWEADNINRGIQATNYLGNKQSNENDIYIPDIKEISWASRLIEIAYYAIHAARAKGDFHPSQDTLFELIKEKMEEELLKLLDRVRAMRFN